MDHNTKQKKNFAFVRFQHEESVKYAVELFRGIKLFGQSLSMQNRKTGVGVQQNRHQNDNGQRMQTVFIFHLVSIKFRLQIQQKILSLENVKILEVCLYSSWAVHISLHFDEKISKWKTFNFVIF